MLQLWILSPLLLTQVIGWSLFDFSDAGEPPPDLFHNLSSSVLLTVFERNTIVFALLGIGHLVVYCKCFYEQYADICFSYGS